MKTWMLVVVLTVLILLLLGKLYVKDSATAGQAHSVEAYLKNYCRENNSYPEAETLENTFPDLYPGKEWYYWPNESLTVATFQYPMTLPLSSAPGSSKFSEFFPVIYAYAVRHPCDGLIK